jgi:hypothetical protein
MEFIGNKNTIGMEFQIENSEQLMGYYRVWMNGINISSKYEYNFFSYFENIFAQISNSEEIDNKLLGNSYAKTYFNLIKGIDEDDNSKNTYKYIINGAGIDDICMLSYKENNMINIVWRPRKTIHYKDLKNIKKKIYHFSIDRKEYIEQVELLINHIKKFNLDNYDFIRIKHQSKMQKAIIPFQIDFHHLLENEVKPIPELDQRKIMLEICLLIREKLSETGIEAIEMIKQSTYKKYQIVKSEKLIKKLRKELPEEGVNYISILLWGLAPHSPSNPVPFASFHNLSISSKFISERGFVAWSSIY